MPSTVHIRDSNPLEGPPRGSEQVSGRAQKANFILTVLYRWPVDIVRKLQHMGEHALVYVPL